MIINSLVAAVLAEHLAECPGSESPVVELQPPDTKRVVEILVGSCGVAVN
jgi:hypothetical protein